MSRQARCPRGEPDAVGCQGEPDVGQVDVRIRPDVVGCRPRVKLFVICVMYGMWYFGGAH